MIFKPRFGVSLKPYSGLGLLLAASLLSACPQDKLEREARPSTAPSQALETIRDWKLSAQGEWDLSAALAQRRGELWQLQQLRWQGSGGISILSQAARELSPQRFALEPLSLTGPGLKAQAPGATLDLVARQLTGGQLQLKGQGWQLSAASFEAGLPLRRWKLKQVRARFERP